MYHQQIPPELDAEVHVSKGNGLAQTCSGSKPGLEQPPQASVTRAATGASVQLQGRDGFIWKTEFN